MVITKPFITTSAPQGTLSALQNPDHPQPSIADTKIVGYTKSIIQINLDVTNNIVAEKISSFKPQPIETPLFLEPADNNLAEEIT